MKAIDGTKEELFEEVKDVPYELPEGWKWVKLGDIAKINPKKSETLMFYGYERDDEVEVSFVPMSYVDDEKGIIVRKDKRFLRKVYKGYTCFKEGDIIFAKITPCMENGKCAIAKNLINGIGFGSTEFHVIRLNEGILNKFIWYYLRSEKIRDEAKKHFTGAVGHKRVPKEFLESLLVPLPFRDYKPDLEKQKQIVEKIEALFKEIDKAIELRQKAIEKTKKLSESVLSRILKEAKENKDSWKWIKLRDIAKINPKKSETLISYGYEKNDEIEVSFIPMNYVDDEKGVIVKKDRELLKRVYKGYTCFKEGDIIFAKITPCMENGKCAIAKNLINGIGFGSTEFHVIRLNEGILNKFIWYYLRSKKVRDEAKKHFTGAVGHKRVPKEFLENLLVPLPFKDGKPDLEKQKQIAEYLNNLNDKIKQLKELQRMQLEKFKQLKENILSKAFRGEIV